MPNSNEFLRHIPNFSLKGDLGGTVVNEINTEGKMVWEADTSLGGMLFTWSGEDLRVISDELGVGVFYDAKGDISSLRVDVLTFVDQLLFQYGEIDEESHIELFEMMNELRSTGEHYMANVELNDGILGLFACDLKTGKLDPITVRQAESFDNPRGIVMTVGEKCMCLMFQKYEDDFAIGAGMVNDSGELDMDATLIVRFINNDCNYMTFLDSKRGDRFERLAKRIFPD